MGRLIDADVALQRFIQETEDSQINVVHINAIKRILQDIDTSYDVKKVVAELEERLPFCPTNQVTCEIEYKLLEAIDIVKRGGVE